MAFLAVVFILAAACLVASLPVGGWAAIEFRGTKHQLPPARGKASASREAT